MAYLPYIADDDNLIIPPIDDRMSDAGIGVSDSIDGYMTPESFAAELDAAFGNDRLADAEIDALWIAEMEARDADPLAAHPIVIHCNSVDLSKYPAVA